MALTHDNIIFVTLIFLCFLIVIFLKFLINQKNKSQLNITFIIIFGLVLSWIASSILQLIFADKYNINIKYFFNIYYISICFLPVAFLFMSLCFVKNKIVFKKIYLLLFIIPILSIFLICTNDIHHLFFTNYSNYISECTYGWYFYIHTIYTYLLFVISIFILLKYTINNSGFFSKQAILILIGSFAPLLVNILGTFKIVKISVYTTPIAFAVTVLSFALAILKLRLFKITPIALQNIVDRISDSYIIINDDYTISDFNKTFLTTFKVKNENSIRGQNFNKLLKNNNLNIEKFYTSIQKAITSTDTIEFELYIENIEKIFNIEITSVKSSGQFIGTLILFKDITQHKKDMETIKNNQQMLIERERLASLGQMVGGIAHSLKTPIFSISGGLEGLTDLIKEFDESIEDPTVNNQDMHEIAKDMSVWIEKMRGHLSYMSEVITTVKGQAVNLSGDDSVDFTISELFSHTNILMRHELQNALVTLNIKNNVDDTVILTGNINSLVQVLNNLISNAIQAYDKKPNQEIDLSAELKNKKIIISIKDYGPGLPTKVKDKLFKEMITTKGKEGTGLGVFMSYSMIKAKFNGDITFETSEKGTTFYINLPI